jgi:hypothetical protein
MTVSRDLRCVRDGIAAQRSRLRGWTWAILATLALTSPASADPLNILFFGNSFTNSEGGARSIPNMVAAIAMAAGRDAPTVANLSVDGVDLGFHLANYDLLMDYFAPPGLTWDVVVLQENSVMPTHVGNVDVFRVNAVALYQRTAAHSPSVVPVLFETWARGPAHEIYSGPTPLFPGGPNQMQQELHEGYRLAASDINAAAGSSITRIAQVGEAFRSTGFSDFMYDEQHYHASPLGSLVAALVIYANVYNDWNVSSLNLSGLLEDLEVDGENYAAARGAVIAVIPETSSLALVGATVVASAGLFAARRRALAA